MNAGTGVDGQAPQLPAGPLVASAEWPVRSGFVPPLADRFSTRPETGPELVLSLGRGPTIVLAPLARRVGAGSSQDWLRCCGKTQQAAFFAEEQWRQRSVDLLVWLDASSKAALLAGYVEVARAVTGTAMPGEAESIAASFLHWLRHTDRRWLAVLDDLSDGDVLAGLWPKGPAGQVVITAANSQAVANLPDVQVLEIGPFSPREAMSYLVGRLSGDPDQRRGAIDLVDDLDCQPLALAHATSAIGNSWMTCTDYRDEFYRRSAVLTPPGAAPPPAAAVTWTLSVDHADQLLPGGAPQCCLAIAAMLDGRGFPVTVLVAPSAASYIAGEGLGPDRAAERAQTAVTVLEQSGLIGVDRASEPPVVQMSTILQRAVRAAMPAQMLEESAHAAAAAMLESWPDSARCGLLCQSMRSSAASLRRATGSMLWNDGCHPVLLRAGRSLDEASLTSAAVEYWTDLTAVGDQVFGPGHPDSMVIVERLASAYLTARRPGEAVGWYQRIVSDWTSALGPDHPRTLEARVSLGRVLVSCQRFDEAIGVLKGALQDCERAYGAGHPQCTIVRDEVAAGYLAARQLADATRLYRLILAERERGLGSQHADTIATRRRLAETYLADGRLKDAFSQYKRVIADMERSHGPDHPDTLRASAGLATAYHHAGKMPLAIQLYEQAYSGSGRVLGPDHPDTLSAAVGLARAYYAVGRLGDASALFRDTVMRGERALAPADPVTRYAREGLAAITGE